jgi:hypothetical protein
MRLISLQPARGSIKEKKKATRHLFWFILAHILVQLAKKEAEGEKKCYCESMCVCAHLRFTRQYLFENEHKKADAIFHFFSSSATLICLLFLILENHNIIIKIFYSSMRID